jgi:hypothetical protein
MPIECRSVGVDFELSQSNFTVIDPSISTAHWPTRTRDDKGLQDRNLCPLRARAGTESGPRHARTAPGRVNASAQGRKPAVNSRPQSPPIHADNSPACFRSRDAASGIFGRSAHRTPHELDEDRRSDARPLRAPGRSRSRLRRARVAGPEDASEFNGASRVRSDSEDATSKVAHRWFSGSELSLTEPLAIVGGVGGEKSSGPSRSAATKQLFVGRPDVAFSTCGSGVSSRTRTDEIFGVESMHVLDGHP